MIDGRSRNRGATAMIHERSRGAAAMIHGRPRGAAAMIHERPRSRGAAAMRLGFLAPALAAGLAASRCAIAAESGTFLVLSGSDTVAVEVYQRSAALVEGELVFRLAGLRFRYSMMQRPDASLSRFTESAWRTSDATDAAPFNRVAIEFKGDSAIADVTPGGLQHLASAPGAVAFINPSCVMMEQMVRRARAVGGDPASVPVLLVSNGRTVHLTVKRIGPDSTLIDLGGVEIRLATDESGAVRGGLVPSQRLTIRRAVYDEHALATTKPDYSAPSGASYVAETVSVPTPGGFSLVGTLSRPKDAKGRLPAVVTITGSGAEDRDEALPGVKDYRPFRQVAETLARRGIAVLRLDDRGFGESGGDAASATSLDFANDVRAALAWLRARPDIDPRRLGLVGHSEGGLIAPLVAETDPQLRAIVLMAGPSRSGRRILEYQNAQIIDRVPLTPGGRDSLMRASMREIDSLATVQPWMRFFLTYEPLETARRVKTPVLILQGATDRQVTADQAPELEKAFRAGGNTDVTLKVFESADHLFANDPDGNPAGYARLPERAVRADVLKTLADWLEKKLK